MKPAGVNLRREIRWVVLSFLSVVAVGGLTGVAVGLVVGDDNWGVFVGMLAGTAVLCRCVGRYERDVY